MSTLNPDQFTGSFIEHNIPFLGKVRDLTSARVSTKNTTKRDRLDTYHSARHAYGLEMEKHAIGYKTEEKEYREAVPPPTWNGFIKDAAH